MSRRPWWVWALGVLAAQEAVGGSGAPPPLFPSGAGWHRLGRVRSPTGKHRAPGHRLHERASRHRRELEEGEWETDPRPEEEHLQLGYGTHFVELAVGTPAQAVTAIVDTGSTFLGFPCRGCENCGTHTDKPFDPRLSDTYKEVSCGSDDDCAYIPPISECQVSSRSCVMDMAYAEGDGWSAVEAQDVVAVAGGINTSYVFGCMSANSGLFQSQLADGILGLDRSTFTYVAELASVGQIDRPAFSLCFGTDGGYLRMGSPASELHTAPMAFAALMDALDNTFFTVQLDEVRIGNSSVPGLQIPQPAVLDSGTTYTSFPKSQEAALTSALASASGVSSVLQVLDSELERMPDLTFVLSGSGGDGSDVAATVSSDRYMEPCGFKLYCLGIAFNSTQVILGSDFFMDHDVYFDPGDGQIGVASADCMRNFTMGSSSGSHGGSDDGTVVLVAVVCIVVAVLGGVLVWHFSNLTDKAREKCCARRYRFSKLPRSDVVELPSFGLGTKSALHQGAPGEDGECIDFEDDGVENGGDFGEDAAADGIAGHGEFRTTAQLAGKVIERAGDVLKGFKEPSRPGEGSEF